MERIFDVERIFAETARYFFRRFRSCFDLISKKFIALSDNNFLRNNNISCIVKRNIFGRIQSGPFLFRIFLLGRRQFFQDFPNRARRTKDIADILKKKVRHEATAHNFEALKPPRNGKDSSNVKFDPLSFCIFTKDREEIKKYMNNY